MSAAYRKRNKNESNLYWYLYKLLMHGIKCGNFFLRLFDLYYMLR